MEVHHHSHGHSQKKWKNYAWEFIMLFLAVFCGCMAEYFLEHKIEHDREKQYLVSLVEDLKDDTTSINKSLYLFEKNAHSFEYIDSNILTLNKSFDKNLLRALNDIIGYRDFIPNDKTLAQLKSAGNLRLIRNKIVTDSIANYDLLIKGFNITANELMTQFNKMFDDYQSIIYTRYADSADIKTKYLINNDEAVIKKYHNHITNYKWLQGFYIIRLQFLKRSNINLLALLKKEYHIE